MFHPLIQPPVLSLLSCPCLALPHGCHKGFLNPYFRNHLFVVEFVRSKEFVPFSFYSNSVKTFAKFGLLMHSGHAFTLAQSYTFSLQFHFNSSPQLILHTNATAKSSSLGHQFKYHLISGFLCPILLHHLCTTNFLRL